MYRITRQIEIDAGHRVPFHNSGCSYLHGHRYRVTVEVAAPEVVPATEESFDSGMVMDFKVLKQILMDEVHEPFDHRMMLWEKDPMLTKMTKANGSWLGIVTVPCIPTAENLARYWGERILFNLGLNVLKHGGAAGLRLLAVIVRETPTSTARWEVD